MKYWESPPDSPSCLVGYRVVGWHALHPQGETWLLQVGSHTPLMCLCARLCVLHPCITASQSFSSKMFCWGRSSSHIDLIASTTSQRHLWHSPHAEGHSRRHIVWWRPQPIYSEVSIQTLVPPWVFLRCRWAHTGLWLWEGLPSLSSSLHSFESSELSYHGSHSHLLPCLHLKILYQFDGIRSLRFVRKTDYEIHNSVEEQ